MKDKDLKPLVSVVIPVYNVERYLDRCINSVISQNYFELEIILVNDGSTDKSLEICHYFEQQDERIKVLHNEGKGLVSARKTGIQAAKGEYIVHLDSDDWVEPDMYGYLVYQAVKHDADVVTCGMYRDYEKSSVKEFDNVPEGVYDQEQIEKKIMPVLMYTGNFFSAGINIHLCNKLFRHELALKNQMRIDDEVRIGEDAAVIYPCILDAKKIVIIHKCFYHYCIRLNSTMGTGYQRELSGYALIYKSLKRKIIESRISTEMLLAQLNYLMAYMLLMKEPQTLIKIDQQHLIPFKNLQIQDKIILYGGGKFGSTLHRYMTEHNLCEVVLWIDKWEDEQRGIVNVTALDDISLVSYDKLVIAVLVGAAADEICGELVNMGVDAEKITRVSMERQQVELISEILCV